MNRQLKRLDEIGQSLKNSRHALALLALGSVGLSLDRLDDYSDLDFFAICEDGYKADYLSDLAWLGSVSPIAYAFQNTKDGFKVLFKDNIFCEFAIFEPHELSNIPFSRGRIIWKKAEFDETVCEPKDKEAHRVSNEEYLLGEAMTNIYVGMCRYRRGEKLSACQFIQEYAFSRVLELMSLREKPQNIEEDRFSRYRRFEFRYPESAQIIGQLLLGYDRIPESAANLLSYLDQNFLINQEMKSIINDLINGH